jgi:Terminase-like family.
MSGDALLRRVERLEEQRAEAAAAPAAKRFKPPTLLDFVQALRIPDRAQGGLIKFVLYPRQVEALDVMSKADRFVGVKSRQIGMTTLCLAIALHATQYVEHRTVLVARQSLEEAKDSIRRLKLMHASIPAEMRPQAIVEDNVQSLAFANGSRIDALTSTSSLGRGRSAYLGIADELAYWPEPESQLVALEAAVERLMVVSTGAGPNDYLHQLWKQASAGKGGWVPLFLDWQSVPSRDAAWHRRTVEEAIEPRLARKEHPSVVEEAFAAAAGIFFERFDPTVNVADVKVVPELRTVRSVDFGFRSAACLWSQVDSRGQRFVVSEYLPHNLTTEEFATGILQRDRALGVRPGVSYVDPAGRAVNVSTAQPEVEVFKQRGLNPASKPSSVRDGCLRTMSALTDPDLPLVISRDCPYLIEALSNVKPDRHRPEIYDDQCEYDHVLDCLRYMLIHVVGKSQPFRPPKRGNVLTWTMRRSRLRF